MAERAHGVKSCYVAGPRTGVADYNRAAFRAATDDLRARGWIVVSPVEIEDASDGMEEGGPGTPLPEPVYHYGLEKCIVAMCSGGLRSVVVLPGWEDSRGAALEVHVGRALGKSILRYPDLSPLETHPGSVRFHEILQGLSRLHDRKQRDYGRADDPFANVRASEDFGVPGWIGTAMRANDKMKRLQTAAAQYLATGTVNLANEGVIDALDDLAVYAVIGRVLFEEQSGAS